MVAKSELASSVKLCDDVQSRATKATALHNELDTINLTSCPTDEEIAIASDLVTTTREALEAGLLIRKAKEVERRIKQTKAEASRVEERAAVLREAAKATDNVLDEQVSKLCPLLKVDDGRLVLETRRGQTYFSELSDGERWKIALDIAIAAVGEHGLIVIPQMSFESLDGFARRAIADQARERGVVILTAESSEDEEVVAEVF